MGAKYDDGWDAGYETGRNSALKAAEDDAHSTILLLLGLGVLLLIIVHLFSYQSGIHSGRVKESNLWEKACIENNRAEYILNKKTGENELTWLPLRQGFRERVDVYGN